jgi:predicted nucleotide-binding protein (sugar kinase/HSP70/actin superfamily)
MRKGFDSLSGIASLQMNRQKRAFLVTTQNGAGCRFGQYNTVVGFISSSL